MASGPITSRQTEGEKVETVTDFLFLGSKNHCRWWLKPGNQKRAASWQESYDKPRQCVEKQRHYSADKGPYSQGYGLPSGHVRLWELDHKEGRTPKNWCLWTVLLEKTPESPLESKEIKPVNLKGNQPWTLIGRTDAEAEAPIFWSSDVNSWLTGKVLDAGKDWGQKEKRAASEDEMAGWHYQCNRHELGQISGDGEGQGGLPCYSLWGKNWAQTTFFFRHNTIAHLRNYSIGFPDDSMVKNPPANSGGSLV